MARRSGDTFGPVVNFDKAVTQRTLTPSQDTFGGQVIFLLRTLLGYEPPTEKWVGVKIKAFGEPSDPAMPGGQAGSLIGYIKQIELDLAGIRSEVQGIRSEVQGIRSDQATANTAIISLLQSIDSKLP